jgi:hypothetical protein
MEYLLTMRRRQDKEDPEQALKRQKMEMDNFRSMASASESPVDRRDGGAGAAAVAGAGNFDALLSRDVNPSLMGPVDQGQWTPNRTHRALNVNQPQSLEDSASRRNQETAAAMLLDSALANSVRNPNNLGNLNNFNMPRVQQPPTAMQSSLPFASHEIRNLSRPLGTMLPPSLDAPANLIINANANPFLQHQQMASINAFNPYLIGFPGFPGMGGAGGPTPQGQADLLQPGLAGLPSNTMSNLALLRSSSSGVVNAGDARAAFMPSQGMQSVAGMAPRSNMMGGRDLASSGVAGNLEDEDSSAGIPMSLPSDESNLSEYQCLIRAQIELFEARNQDIECNAQGRNKPIKVGQVGIRCKHCTILPPGRRPRGAVYFPAKLPGLYQAAQNMAINHFTESCASIPEATRARILRLKAKKATVLGGGKQYWANGARVLGIVETENGLIFDHKKSWKNSQG